MRAAASTFGLHANRAVDLSRVDAVGFDLDHTLALYDDHALNLLAASETVDLLVERRGYAPSWLDGMPTEPIPPVRTMALDFRHGAVLKLDARQRVRLARRGHAWLDAPEMASRYVGGGGELDPSARIHSPFDIPVVWLFEHLAPRDGDGRRGATDLPALASDIRRVLDVVHTQGLLKGRVARDLARFVTPAGNAAARLRLWAESGKQLFVVTNSHRDYAELVLDAVIGCDWRSLFAAVVVDAGKPAFFDPGRVAGSTRRSAGRGAAVIEGAAARDVETMLGAVGERILYVGDNLRTDVMAARSFGWRTALVVAELEAPRDASPWGWLLAHDGFPTWFSRALLEHADLVCDRVDRLLETPPAGALEPRTDFLARIGCGDTA
jgi:HAD superfamily 5'-nucleotidase-like hydrolase